jgi:hypothetical protein
VTYDLTDIGGGYDGDVALGSVSGKMSFGSSREG